VNGWFFCGPCRVRAKHGWTIIRVEWIHLQPRFSIGSNRVARAALVGHGWVEPTHGGDREGGHCVLNRRGRVGGRRRQRGLKPHGVGQRVSKEGHSKGIFWLGVVGDRRLKRLLVVVSARARSRQCGPVSCHFPWQRLSEWQWQDHRSFLVGHVLRGGLWHVAHVGHASVST
jgi:hypothetical protein